MRIKVLIGILIFLIVINLAAIGSFLYYQWQKPARMPFRQEPGMQQFRELELDKAQRRQLRDLLMEFKSETEPLHNKIRDLEDEIFAMLQEDTLDRGLINEKLEMIAELRLEISKKMIDKFHNTREFLSPIQQKHFFDALMKGRPGPMGRGQRFRQDRPGPPDMPPPQEDQRF